VIVKGNKHHVRCFLLSQDDAECVPEIDADYLVISARPLDLRFLFAKLRGMRTARYWTGNDAWKYQNRFFYWLRAKFTNWFVDRHYFLAEHLKVRDLEGEVRIIKTELELAPLPEPYDAVILWYDAEGTFPDRYGKKTIERLKRDFPAVLFFRIPPGIFDIREMQFILGNADAMIRPSFWDGDPFLVREAFRFRMPIISTFSNIADVMKCNPDDYEEIHHMVHSVVYEKK